MPQYELKKVTGINSYSEGTNIISECTVVSGIVGDTYEFNKWDALKVVSPNTMTGAEIEQNIQQKAMELVATKYPNT